MKKILDFIDATPITKICSASLMMAMAVVMTMNVILRYVFHFSFNWGDEILRYLCIYMAFLGTAAGFRYGSHIGVTIFVEKVVPEPIRKYFRLLSDIIVIVFMCIVTYFSFILIGKVMASNQLSSALHVPMYCIYGIIPVCCILSIIQQLLQIFRHKSYLLPRE